MGQEPRHSLARSSGSGPLISLQSRCQLGCDLIGRLDWGRIHSELTHMVVGGLLTRVQTLNSLPCRPLHRVLQRGSFLHQSEQERRAERRVPARWKPVFYNLISEVTSYRFNCILLVRSKSPGPAPRIEDHTSCIPGG